MSVPKLSYCLKPTAPGDRALSNVKVYVLKPLSRGSAEGDASSAPRMKTSVLMLPHVQMHLLLGQARLRRTAEGSMQAATGKHYCGIEQKQALSRSLLYRRGWPLIALTCPQLHAHINLKPSTG